jgi:hypothetical protein
MKALRTEIRLLIAETFLGWAFSVAPFGKEGEAIKVMLAYYFDAKVKGKS